MGVDCKLGTVPDRSPPVEIGLARPISKQSPARQTHQDRLACFTTVESHPGKLVRHDGLPRRSDRINGGREANPSRVARGAGRPSEGRAS